MERTVEKKLCRAGKSWPAVSTGLVNSPQKKRNDDADTDTETNADTDTDDTSLADDVAQGGRRQGRACMEEGSTSVREESHWSFLDADILVEVFSLLPQKNMFEFMLINKHWEKSVMEGRVLWRKVDVAY